MSDNNTTNLARQQEKSAFKRRCKTERNKEFHIIITNFSRKVYLFNYSIFLSSASVKQDEIRNPYSRIILEIRNLKISSFSGQPLDRVSNLLGG